MDNGASSYRRYLEGDKNAIGEIIAEYKNGLILYLNSIFNNIDTAEDVAEDTFAALAIKKPRYSAKSSFKTFLFAIGRHKASAYLRKHRRIGTVTLDECAELPDGSDVERELLRTERNIMLHKAISELKPEYRQVLILAYFEDMSNEEIARVMKKSKKQIEDLIYNAKKSLKSRLERSGTAYEEL